MSGSVSQGGRRLAWAGVVGLLAAAVLLTGASRATAGAETAQAGGAAKKCTKAVVDGRNACLRKGDRCKKRFQEDYVRAGFSCRKRELRRASIAELRGPEPVLIDKKGQISLETALAAFDTGIADLPGVKPKKGQIGDLGDPTFVIGAIQRAQNKLSKQQRKVLQAVTTPAPDALTIPVEDVPAARLDPQAAAGQRTSAERRAGGDITVSGGTVDEQIIALEHIRNARNVMRSHGFLLLRPLTVSFLDTNKKIKGKNVYAYVPYDDMPPGTSPTCNIFITKLGREADAATQELVYAHELAHCAQHAFFSTRDQMASAPAWVIEGGADWLGGMTVQELGDSVSGVDWNPWLKLPEFDLFGRAYSGVGFFAMINQTGVDGWQRMRDTLFASTGGPQAAFARATAGLPDIFWTRWGPGLVRNAGLGAEWNYEGPGIPTTKPEEVKLANGKRHVRTIQARSSDGFALSINADVLVIKADKDLRGELNTEGATRKLAKGAYCAKAGGCKCSTQTNLQLPQVGSVAYAGFSDPFKPRTVTLEGVKLKDYCKKPRPGPGEPGSCTTTPSARANGDSCPVPAAGINIYNDPEAVNQVASFKIGDCTVGPGGFTAISVDGAWRLEVGIQNFTGFGQEYTIPYGGPDPQVIIEGPGGPYGNTTWAPPGLPFAGSIVFDAEGRQMGLGFIEFRNADESAAIAGAGGMTCVYPDD